jgi:hypothetical protein
MNNITFTIHSDTPVSNNTHIPFNLIKAINIFSKAVILACTLFAVYEFDQNFNREKFLEAVENFYSDLKPRIFNFCTKLNNFYSDLKTRITDLVTEIFNFCTEPENFSIVRTLSQELILFPIFYTATFSEISSSLPFLAHSIIVYEYFFALELGSDLDYDICDSTAISRYFTSVINTFVSFFIIYYVTPSSLEFSFYWSVLIFILLLLKLLELIDDYYSIKILQFCGAIILLHFRLDIISFIIFIGSEAFIASEYFSLKEIIDVKRIASQKIIKGMDENTLIKIVEEQRVEYEKNKKIDIERLEKLSKENKERLEKLSKEEKLKADKKDVKDILDSIINNICEKKSAEADEKVFQEVIGVLESVIHNICEKEVLAKLEADKKEADKKATEEKAERERLAKVEIERLAKIEKLNKDKFNGIINNIEIWKDLKKRHFFDFTDYVPDKYDYIPVKVGKTSLWETQSLYHYIKGKHQYVKCIKALKGTDFYDDKDCKIDFVKEEYFVKVLNQ